MMRMSETQDILAYSAASQFLRNLPTDARQTKIIFRTDGYLVFWKKGETGAKRYKLFLHKDYTPA